MPFECWNKIFSKVYTRLNEEFEHKFLKGAILNIIWVSFYTSFDFIKDLLSNCDKLQAILTLLVQDAAIYVTNYDKKVNNFLISLLKIL